MCGIAGIVFREPRDAAETEARLQCMRDALRHRGPDDSGIHVSGDLRVGFMNTRLAIRDLTPSAHMPMRSPDGTLCLTYNGEIYNAAELREELQRLGYSFRSTGDTEVVLAGFQYWRDDVVHKLRGMFAFGIADTAADRIFLARDPLGIKPLYYAQIGNDFVFASEIKALLTSGLVARTIEPAAVSAFLQLGSVPAPLTMISGVSCLEPGCTLSFSIGAEARTHRYYNLPSPTESNASPGSVRNALASAVQSHLVADVEVGAFLSGGLDSSALVALAAQFSDRVTTCSIRFAESAADESAYARSVAARYDTLHYEIQLSARDLVHRTEDIVRAMDQPSIDGFNTYFISKAASEAGLKVVLSGLGGDELFGGYPTFRGVPRVMRAVRSARLLVPTMLERAIRGFGRNDRWRKVADAVARPVSPEAAFLTYRGLFTAHEAAALHGAEPFDAHAYVSRQADGSGELGDWVSRAELKTYTANQLLRDADIMSMAHSLELRVPFLDTDLVSEVLAIPASQRLAGDGIKPMLRTAVQDLLPQDVLGRREKRGFSFPMAEWLATPDAAPLWDWASGVFDDLDRSELNRIRQGFNAGRTHWSRPWSLIVLNHWSRQLASD